MFQESDDRLAGASHELRSAEMKQEALDRAESAVLSRFEPKRRPFRLRGLVWTTAATAAAAAGALLMLPSRSGASELSRVLQNGDIGMRHVRAYSIQPDGSKKLNIEFYADGRRARMQTPNEQVFFEDGVCTIVHDDGSTEVEKITSSNQIWFNYSAKQILAVNAIGEKLKVSITHRAMLQGKPADRYVLDVDMPVNHTETVHRHSVLFADPATERPLQVQTEVTGATPELETWEYPPSDPSVWRIPPIDKSRLYDVDSQQKALHEAPGAHGPSVVVAGHRVELIQLWMDDRGNAMAIAEADYAHPTNFSLRIDGSKLGSDPEDEQTTRRYALLPPWKMQGRSIDLFGGYDSKAAPKPAPKTVSVSIPVFTDGKIEGFAEFHNVEVHRCWNAMAFVEGPGSPFQPIGPGSVAAAAAPADADGRP